jgi:2-oxoglutarate ferredoxin oxidoreductase subunit beta
MMDNLGTGAENTWCPGCANFGILNAAKKAVKKLEERGIGRDRILMSAGIGCHAKMFDYLALSGLYSLHGRSIATVQGMKLANPDLKVITFVGDGDSLGEGLAHLMFAAKRNADITVILHDNGVYALTTGQFSPLACKGFKGPSTPRGSIEEPFNPLTLMLEAGATFVARGFPGRQEHMADLMVAAVEHEGFAFIDVLQSSITFHDTFKEHNSLVEELDKVPDTIDEARVLAARRDRLPIGIIYRVQRPAYHTELYDEANPVVRRKPREERIAAIRALVAPRKK